jgi:hypothetical protein
MIAMQEAAYTQARAESSPALALVCVSPRVVQSRVGIGARWAALPPSPSSSGLPCPDSSA